MAARSLAARVLIGAIFLTVCLCYDSKKPLHKRADDGLLSIQKLAQDQNALIQSLQSQLLTDQPKLTELDNRLNVQTNATAYLESRVRQHASLLESMEASIRNTQSGSHGGVFTSCPQDWIEFQGSCYAFGSEQATFAEALEICEVSGGTLAHIDNAEENEFIRQKVLSYHENTWLGGTDILHEGHWVWISTGVEISVHNSTPAFGDFDHGEPNDGNNEDCLAMADNHHFHWDDRDCANHFRFVCEITRV